MRDYCVAVSAVIPLLLVTLVFEPTFAMRGAIARHYKDFMESSTDAQIMAKGHHQLAVDAALKDL